MVRPRIGQVPYSRWLRVPIIAICLIALLVLVIRLAQPMEPRASKGPSIRSRLVEWVCQENAQHRFRKHFRFESLQCPTCGGKCEILLDYICPEHKGPFSVLVRFARDPNETGTDDGAVVREYRYLDVNNWHASNGTVLCPKPDCTLIARRAKKSWASAKTPSGPGGQP